MAPQEIVVQQDAFTVPDITIKELLNAVPPRCFKRSALRSFIYLFWDLAVISAIYGTTTFLNAFVDPAAIYFRLPFIRGILRFALWFMYGFFVGLFATGLWVIAHECGHHAFSESRTVNHTVGWILHSAFGVPYHSWRITHAKHHAATGHMTEDQYYVPWTRSERRIGPFDPSQGDLHGSRISKQAMKELYDALSDSPVSSFITLASYLLAGLPGYIMFNLSGQSRYPKGTSLLNPYAILFAPGHYWLIIVSNVGIILWLTAIGVAISKYGFLTVFSIYLVPYFWVNHWIILITFLQHTDPILPRYRPAAFTFARGALTTVDRVLLGDLGPFWASLAGHATNGIAETHVAHHVCTTIPHYNAWEATAAIKKFLAARGVYLDGSPAGWVELYRVYKECKFVEDEGDVVFFKNACGLARVKPVSSVAST